LTSERFDDLFAALADPTRRRLLDLIAAQGEASATMLAADVSVSRQAVVKHLGVLEEAGLVSRERRGREVVHAVRPDRLGAAARWMAAAAAEWDARLAAIRRLAESDRPAARSRRALGIGRRQSPQ
jgi:DNA-binding transcriptional ArsR family regulator